MTRVREADRAGGLRGLPAGPVGLFGARPDGEVYGHIARQNSRYRETSPGDPGYGRGVLVAMAFPGVASLNHAIGQVSEASIGNVGLTNHDQQGWVDPVITPTLGIAWMVTEDVAYEKVLAQMAPSTRRAFWHLVLKPSRSRADLCAGRNPRASCRRRPA